MVDRPNKPSALTTTPSLPPQAVVSFTHDNSCVSAVLPTGESVEVLLYGATVISWKMADGTEKLWVSDAAKLDGSKAVRGGIPLVFPVFATAPNHEAASKLPQHGFARNSAWELLGTSKSESGDASVKLDFGLSSSGLEEATRNLWPHDFNLLYSVTLDARTLNTSLIVTNTGDELFECQALMHTYFKIKDITTTVVAGLKGASYIDKVDGAAVKTESASEVPIAGETDRVYTPINKDEPVAIFEDGYKTFSVALDNLDDVVVWNPWVDKAARMADFEPKDGWKTMICVEAGSVKGWIKLENGDQFEGAQTITSL